MSRFRIRPATDADGAAIAEIVEQAYEVTGRGIEAGYKRVFMRKRLGA
jgi:hypothetical protein